MRLKALADIYKNLNALLCTVLVGSVWVKKYTRRSIFCLKIAKTFANFLPILYKLHFVKISLQFVDFRADFYRNFTKSRRINKHYQIFAENCEKNNCEI